MNREGIKSEIKREVRQRCGFGCVICGNPIYDYEHMEEWAVVKRHIASEITLLCPFHHREKTSGRLPAELVKKANEKPHNLKTGQSGSHELYFYGKKAVIWMNNVGFTCEDEGRGNFIIPILIDNIPVINIRLKDNECFLNFVLFDRNGMPLLVIQDNIIKFKIGFWDVTFVGKTLTIREKSYKIALEIVFNAPDTVVIKRANLFYNGTELIINKDGIKLRGKDLHVGFKNLTFVDFKIVFSIGRNDTGIPFFMGDRPYK